MKNQITLKCEYCGKTITINKDSYSYGDRHIDDEGMYLPIEEGN